MKTIKLRIAHATVAGNKGVVVKSIDKDGNTICMAFGELEDDGTVDILVDQNGSLISESEPNWQEVLDGTDI